MTDRQSIDIFHWVYEMKSRAIVKKERFTYIVNSKRLSEILTAYFDVSPSM